MYGITDNRLLRRERLSSGAAYLVRDPAEGSDRTVLLVHGLGSTSAAWEPVVRHAPDDIGLVIPDLPGFGVSPTGDATPLDAATAMVGELLDRAVHATEVAVVAHSVGTMVVLKALRRAAGAAVPRLVLVAGTLLSASRVLATPRSVVAAPALTAMVGVHTLAGVIPVDRRAAVMIARHPALRRMLLWPFLALPRNVPDDDLLAVLPHRGGPEPLRAIWSSRDVALADLMTNLGVATRIVHGAEDRLIDDGDVRAARDLLHADDVVALECCGHWPHIERPVDTAAAAFAR